VNNHINLRIGFIGAGKVGVTLGAYFKGKGLNVAGYASKRYASAIEASIVTSTYAYSDILQLVENCDMVFITAPDDQIKNVWKELLHCNLDQRIICHTSGSLSSDVFIKISEYGAYGYSIHPMCAFSDMNGKIDGLKNAHFSIEGDSQRMDMVKNLISGLGNKITIIEKEKKILYHLANVMVSNFVLSLVSMGCGCFEECGVDREEALHALLPLVTGNIENISRHGYINALTGPVERNDIGTVKKHIDVLPSRYERIYKDLTLRLIELAGMKHPERDYSKLKQLMC